MTPEITPDSPVSVLWQDGDGGLTGARAKTRLEWSSILTVGQLVGMDAADVLDMRRSGKSVLAEIRRALTANGLRLTGDPRPTTAAVEAAREAGREEAQRNVRRKRQEENLPPATAEEFAELVKDLRVEIDEADDERRARLLAIPRGETPASFGGRKWAWFTVGPAGVSEITGYSPATIRRRVADSVRAYAAGTATVRDMPARQGSGWAIGDLALWIATRNEGQAQHLKLDDDDVAAILADIRAARRPEFKGRNLPDGMLANIAAAHGVSRVLIKKLAYGDVPARGRKGALKAQREPRKPRPDDEAVSVFLARAIASQRGHVTVSELMGEVKAAGLGASQAQVERLLPPVRAAEIRKRYKPAGLERARGESMRPDGLQTAQEVAEDFGITPQALDRVRRRGDVISVKERGRRLYDPKRLRVRDDRRLTPVDVTHPKARLEPGDEGYTEG